MMRIGNLQRPFRRFDQLSSAAPRNYSHSRTGFDDYTKGRENFNLHVPKEYNFARNCFDLWASQTPEKTALWWIDDHKHSRRYSYLYLSELSKRSNKLKKIRTSNKRGERSLLSSGISLFNRLANGLTRGASLTRGDRVIAILPRIPEWWLLTLACIRAGIVVCPGTTLLTAKDISWRLKTASASAIIIDGGNMHKVEEIADELPELKKICVSTENCPAGWLKLDDLTDKGSVNHECADTLSSETMNLFFTSGTTGLPKMVEHTYASYGLAHTISGRYWLDLTADDVMWSNSDPGWAKTAYSTFGPWAMGAAVFTHDTPRFDPVVTLKVLSDYPITTFCAPPTGYRFLVQQNIHEYKMKSLSHAVSAGEPLNPEALDAWNHGTGVAIKEGYGQTETVLCCGNFKCIDTKPGSMGKAAPGFDIKIVDDEGKELEPHTEGNLAISTTPHRPVGLFTGYVGDADRNRSVFVGGSYLCGDRAYRDEDDYIWYVGRADDVILSAGYRIGPFEVESALQEHPAVLESAVVSSPDADRGEVVKAFVVLTEQARNADLISLKHELQDHVKRTTAPYKYPRKIEFTDQLPKTVSGKTRRVELREQEWRHDRR